MSTANPSYKPSEGKREEFRKYLEKNGVMDALTRVLVNLYEEADKPDDALEYIRDKMAVMAGLETTKQLQMKLADAEERIKELESQLQTGDGPVEDVSAPTASTPDMPFTEDQIKTEDDAAPPPPPTEEPPAENPPEES
ncbi:c-Myc-binding protein homolog [Anthonomus grandis grandis]|uniref:c-Myc-binding protein homolog n=1 Tax=Anthonomus grandis grandis TaxID=2921223 RepID=UPI0021665B11|nr:c-Myc-binding protein homolog [Anthonomus grandis grandis]